MKKNNIIVFVIIFFIYACKDKKQYFYPTGELYSIVEIDKDGKNHGLLKTFYKTGEIKSIGNYIHGNKSGIFKTFYKTGQIKAIEKYDNNIWLDTTKFYYINGTLSSLKYKNDDHIFLKQFTMEGNLFAEGEIKDTFNIGWWKEYRKSGKLKRKVEFLIKDNKNYINQVIYYNLEEKIVKDSSNYMNLKLPDTIQKNKLVVGEMELIPRLSKKLDFYMVYFKQSNKNKNDFMPIDSSYGKNNKPAKIWVKFNNSGPKSLKGYIIEKAIETQINEKDSSRVDIISIEHKIYFGKVVYVIDG